MNKLRHRVYKCNDVLFTFFYSDWPLNHNGGSNVKLVYNPEQTIGLRNRVIFSDSLLSVWDSIIIGFNLQTKFFKYSFQTNNLYIFVKEEERWIKFYVYFIRKQYRQQRFRYSIPFVHRIFHNISSRGWGVAKSSDPECPGCVEAFS